MSLLDGFKLWHVGAVLAPCLGGLAAWYDLRESSHIQGVRLEAVTEDVRDIKDEAATRHVQIEAKMEAAHEQFQEFRIKDETREALNEDINERFREVEREAHRH